MLGEEVLAGAVGVVGADLEELAALEVEDGGGAADQVRDRQRDALVAVEVGAGGVGAPDDPGTGDEVLGLGAEGGVRVVLEVDAVGLEAPALEVARVDVEGDALFGIAARLVVDGLAAVSLVAAREHDVVHVHRAVHQ